MGIGSSGIASARSSNALDEDAEAWAALEEAEGTQKQPQKQAQALVFREERRIADQGRSGVREDVKQAAGTDGGKANGSEDVKHGTGDHVEFCNDQGKWVPAVVKSVSLNSKGAVMFY